MQLEHALQDLGREVNLRTSRGRGGSRRVGKGLAVAASRVDERDYGKETWPKQAMISAEKSVPQKSQEHSNVATTLLPANTLT